MRKRRIGLLIAWVAATALATVLASQAVALVRDQVTDRPSRVATTLALDTTTSTTLPPTTINPIPPRASTTTTDPEPTNTTSGATTSSTQPQTTTTSTPPTTSTTIRADQEQTFYLTGGWATVRCAGNEVELTTYAPNPGYKVDIESAGPNKVEINFEEAGGEHESKLDVRCKGGELNPQVEEHDDD
jgi:hypothetical protein